MATTKKQVLKNDKKVHHYLKAMEIGEDAKDTETLKGLHKGSIQLDHERVKEYLTKRL
jgi:hypothetical protein